jgi:hypothetical protein
MNSNMYALLAAATAPALIRWEPPRHVVPAGQNHEEIKEQVERKNQVAGTRRFLNVGKRKKLKR